MAFGKITKQDLIDAGLDPDKIKEFQEKGITKDELTGMKTEFTTALSAITASITALESKLVQQPLKKEEGKVDDEPKPNTDKDDFYTDPTAWVNSKVNQSVAFTAVQATRIRMDLAMDRAKATLRGFKNGALTEEIMKEWEQYKPETFAMSKDFDPDKLLLKIHNMVLGNHIDDINRDTDKRDGKFNMVASGGSGGGGSNGPVGGGDNKKVEDQLTEVEIKQAARYGMKPEEWVKQQKDMAEEEQKVLAQK